MTLPAIAHVAATTLAGITGGLLLAAAEIPSEVGGGVLGGVGGVGVGGVSVWWLIRRHDDKMQAALDRHGETVEALTTKFDQALEKKDGLIETLVTKFDAAIREMRAENQRNVERQFEHATDMVAALEHVNAGQRDLHAGQVAMQRVLQELSGRVDALDGPRR